MPLYEYQCPKCGLFEIIRKFSDEAVTACPTCGSEVQKLASAPAFHLKGTGWYATDYAKKSKGDTSGKGSSEEGKSSENKSSDSKSGERKSGESKPSDSKSGESGKSSGAESKKGAKDATASTTTTVSKKTD